MFRPISHFRPTVVDESTTLTKVSIFHSHIYYQCNYTFNFISTPKKFIFPYDGLLGGPIEVDVELNREMGRNPSVKNEAQAKNVIKNVKSSSKSEQNKSEQNKSASHASHDTSNSPSHAGKRVRGSPEIRLNDLMQHFFWMHCKDESFGPYKMEQVIRCIALDANGRLQCYASYENEWISNGELNLFEQENHFMKTKESSSNVGKSEGSATTKGVRESTRSKSPFTRSLSPLKRFTRSSSKQVSGSSIPSPQIKHACLVADSILVVQKTDNSVSAYTLSFEAQTVQGRQETVFGTEREYIANKRIDVSKFVTISEEKIKEGGFRSTFTINWCDVNNIIAAKEGIWIFSPYQVYYMSLFSLLNAFHSNYNNLNTLDFPTSTVHTAQSHNTDSPYSTQEDKFVKYISCCVHSTSRELITLDEEGKLRVYSVSPIMRSKIVVKTIYFEELRPFISKRSSETNKPDSQFIELLPTSNHFLCVLTQDRCLLLAPAMKTFFGEVHLPSELIMSKHEKRSSKFGRSVLWDYESSQKGFGIFSKNKVFVFDPPSLRDIIHKRMTMNHANEIESRKEFAEFLKEYGHENWFVKIYLEIMMKDGKRGEISRATKKSIMELLCSHLENPALVWSSSSSLCVQNQVLFKVQEFMNQFPQTKSVQNEGKPTHPAQTFQSMTWLNLSVLPKLSDSIALAKNMLQESQQPVVTKSKENILDTYTDIEIHDNFDLICQELLSELCIKYGLEFLQSKKADYISHVQRDEVPDEHVMKAALHDVVINKTTSHLLISRFSSTFQSWTSIEGDHRNVSNEQLLRGFSHMYLLVRCLFNSEYPYRILLFVLLLEKIQLQILDDIKKESKLLDSSQKKEFQQLLEKDYRKHYSRIVVNILTFHDDVPYFNSDLHSVRSEKELKHTQILSLGQILRWSGMYIEAFKLYLHYNYVDHAIAFLEYVKQKLSGVDEPIILQILVRYYTTSCAKGVPMASLEKIKSVLQNLMEKRRINPIEQIDLIGRLSSQCDVVEDPILPEDSSFTVDKFMDLLCSKNELSNQVDELNSK